MGKIIEVENLSYTYPESERGIKNISFSMEEGEVLGIIGPTGSGKTTLLFSICGLLEGKGRVVIDGVELNHKTFDIVREKIGFVFQDPDDQLFMPTVLQDVGFPLFHKGMSESAIRNKVEEVLRRMGIHGIEERETHKLSYGEKKKVCIAGALIHDPKILILDEPTAWLDPSGRKELMGIIKELGKTTIIAGHDIGMIKRLAHRLLLLEKGSLLAFGKTDEVLSLPHLLRRIGFDEE